MIDLSSKTAVVTGAGQGVGLGIATAMAKKGAKVAMLGRTFSKVKNESTKLNEAGFITLALECDVKEPDSISNAQAEIKNNFGSVNVLINNAQEVPLGSILDVTDEAINAGWESGPLATFRLMKLFYEDLKGDGAVINLASSSALRPDSSGYGAYAAVKEAIRSLTRAAAVEWGKDNIRVNTIMPLANSVALLLIASLTLF